MVINRIKELSNLFGIKKIFNKFPLFRTTLYKILWLFAPKRPRVINTQHGFKLLIIPRDRGVGFPLWIGHEFEPETVKIFQKHVKPGDKVFDIGANIGYFTMLASKLVGNAGKVVSFEPIPEFLEMLKFSANVNNFLNIFPIEIALSDKPGEGIIYMDVENYGLASVSLYNVLKPKQKILKIKFTTLDLFVSENKIFPNFIKIDVQGFEFKVLKGAVEVLKSPKLKLYFEFWPRGIKNVGDEPEEIFNLLSEFEFNIFQVLKNGSLQLLTKDIFLKLSNKLLQNQNFLASINLYAEK